MTESRLSTGPVVRFDPGDDPLTGFRRAQCELVALCDLLESIADSLPSRLDPERCRAAASMLEQMLREIHRFEEEKVFPLVRPALEKRHGHARCIDRLRAEHCEDQSYAGELAQLLNGLASGDRPVQAETAGYMLRGFFVSMRRHIAFESDCLLTLLESGIRPD